MNKYSYDSLLTLSTELLESVGVSISSSKSVAEGVCEASLRGVDSHGVRLLPHYLECALTGRKNGNPNYIVKESYPAAISIDADNAYGLAVGEFAINEAMKRASDLGVCAVSVTNSSHPGAMASTVLRAAREGYLCFGFTNADSLVVSTNSNRPYFGTNPVCFAAPRDGEEPFCLDMAVSKMPWNKVLLHKASGLPLPEGHVSDSGGMETVDPNEAAALFPVGDYKGFALGAMVEVLCGVLAGGAFGRDLPAMYNAPMDRGRGLSQFYLLFKSDLSQPESGFLNSMTTFTNAIRSEPQLDEEPVMVPNDPQIKFQGQRLMEGVPVDDVTIRLLKEYAAKYDVTFPEPFATDGCN